MSFCSPGEAWRLEDDCTDPPRDPQLSTAVEDAPFSYFRTRSFYMRKSLSVDNHLGTLSYAVHPAETKAERVKTKLRRQFVSIGVSGPPVFMCAQLPKNSLRELFLCSALPKQQKKRLLQPGRADGSSSSSSPASWQSPCLSLLVGSGSLCPAELLLVWGWLWLCRGMHRASALSLLAAAQSMKQS